ncbi:DUF6332 family protein [Streptomyces sp. SID8367]|uniref:DUF6332 family protein n=2 Tax=unclassified Streptomyces TaxID=2593676 RepID=UPI0021AC2024|nr:DUF6332 family protein [Streptomyces sp. SID8367]
MCHHDRHDTHGGHHGDGTDTQAERDAMTVEIGFALFTGALSAGAVFALLALPAFLGMVPAGARTGVYAVAGTVAAVAFLVRVVRVLSRFDRRRSAADEPGPRA